MAVPQILITNISDSSNGNDNDFINFLQAAENGNIDVMTDFLSRRSEDINLTDDHYGAGAIHLAAQSNQMESLQFLLNNNANVNLRTNSDNTALHYAISQNNYDITEFLLQREDIELDYNVQDLARGSSDEIRSLVRHTMVSTNPSGDFNAAQAKRLADEITQSSDSYDSELDDDRKIRRRSSSENLI